MHPREASTPLASRVFVDAAQTWKFKPIVLGGTNPVPACALVRLSHPPITYKEVLPVAFELPERSIRVPPQRLKLVVGSKTIVPDDEDKMKLMHSHVERVIGSFMFCFDETGTIDRVGVLEPTVLRRYNEKIQRTIATTWKYAPYIVDGKPVRVCTAATFIYTQR